MLHFHPALLRTLQQPEIIKTQLPEKPSEIFLNLLEVSFPSADLKLYSPYTSGFSSITANIFPSLVTFCLQPTAMPCPAAPQEKATMLSLLQDSGHQRLCFHVCKGCVSFPPQGNTSVLVPILTLKIKMQDRPSR